jgi:hypothetical protein
MAYSELYADGSRGVYIPQYFAESHAPEKWTGIDAADLEILRAGPDHEFYWDAWTTVLDNAETTDGAVLHQDGDLWVIHRQAAIDAINAHCEARLDYETDHRDAGDNYAHMPAESWCSESDARLRDELARHEIDTRGLPVDVLSDLALDLFTMRRGSVFGPYTDGVILESYAIQEIEIELDPLGIDEIVMGYVRESCEPYITGTDRAYLTTDAVWYAVVDPANMALAIAERAQEMGV